VNRSSRHSRKSKVPLLGQFGVGRPFRLATFCGRDQVGRGAGVKAVVYDRYGSPDVLRVEEVSVPSPAAGQVRVKIAATSVNLSDWECLRGSPAYARIGGLRFPACRTLGSDIAGLVDDVGEGVTRFRPGDEVYGDNLRLKGGFAAYTLAPESALATTSTAPSRSTKFPPRLLMSVRDAHPAKSLSSSPDAIRTRPGPQVRTSA
jgi:hypothetical protein